MLDLFFPLSITWTIDPILFKLGPLTIRWYGLLFALGFLIGYYIEQSMFRHEKVELKWLDTLLVYLMVATIVGARLGHVLFYDWAYYSQNPMEIFMVWHGGLASHGGAIGIIMAMWLFSKLVSKRPMLWILDRIVVPIALTGCFIRLGNLMNHEIIGQAADLPWAFIFTRVDMVPRHPAQLYESTSYLIIFGILMFLYWRTDVKDRLGFLFGSFLVLIFGVRFFIEYVKQQQAHFLNQLPMGIGEVMNMGQLLSIPFVLIGLFFIIRGWQRGPKPIP